MPQNGRSVTEGSFLFFPNLRRTKLVIAIFVLAALAGLALAQQPSPAKFTDDQSPWKPSETIDAARLAKILDDPRATNVPIIVCVGFHTLYEGAHIRGASFHGPASTPQGLDNLKQWAKGLPLRSNLVIYCGCCPLAHCPNVQPAFTALRDMGFTHLQVLILPHDFATDWVRPGYPTAKGK